MKCNKVLKIGPVPGLIKDNSETDTLPFICLCSSFHPLHIDCKLSEEELFLDFYSACQNGALI